MTVSWSSCPPWLTWQATIFTLYEKFHDLAKMLAKIFAEINKSPKGYYKIGKICERKYVFVFEKLFATTNRFAKIYAKWRGRTIFVNFVKTDKTSRVFAFILPHTLNCHCPIVLHLVITHWNGYQTKTTAFHINKGKYVYYYCTVQCAVLQRIMSILV